MPGLKDTAKSFKTVSVNGTDVSVPGISAEGIAYLFHRFPIVRELIGGKEVDLTPEALAKLAPEAVAAIIATGCGEVNDPIAEQAAGALPLESQMDLLEAIIGETMPSGVVPFVQRLSKTFDSINAAQSISIPVGK